MVYLLGMDSEARWRQHHNEHYPWLASLNNPLFIQSFFHQEALGIHLVY